MGSKGKQAIEEFSAEAGDDTLVQALILFTYADRVAVYLDPNKNSNDAMVLSQMLGMLPGGEGKQTRKSSTRNPKAGK